MCPLRLILVFLSATLAGYFAWKSIRSNPGVDSDEHTAKTTPENTSDSSSKTIYSVIGGGFWGFVDMASGRYLWRNLRVINQEKEKKLC